MFKHCGDRHDCVFSKNMLIDRLVYNKFTKEETKKALDIVEIDYIDQAQQEAKKILLKETGGSRRNIIYLLVHGGKFTKEEAEKGVDLLNHDFKVNLRRAIEYHCIESDYNRDKEYPNSVRYFWHSKQHLIEVSSDPNGLEGFERSDVEEVIEEYSINYTKRARLRAIDLLKNGKYSRSNLIKTLTNYWKFTEEEATNAVKDLKHENLID